MSKRIFSLYGVVSLLDMLDFYAKDYLELVSPNWPNSGGLQKAGLQRRNA